MALHTITLKLTDAEMELLKRLRELKHSGGGWRSERYESNSDVFRKGLKALGRLHKLLDEDTTESLEVSRSYRGHPARRGPRFRSV